jgi:hypothetical protein
MRRKAETISGYFSSLAHYIGIGDCAQQPLIRPNNNIPALNLWLTVMLKGMEFGVPGEFLINVTLSRPGVVIR